MKKLLLHSLLPLLLTAAILFFCGTAYRQTNTYRNLERNEESEKFHAVPDIIDVAVFGSSHGRDLFPSFNASDAFFNFSMSSQTPQYDEKMMHQFADRFHEDTLIILTVSYISPYWVDSDAAFESKQPRYYRIMDAENIVDVDLIQYYLQQFSPILTTDFSEIVRAFTSSAALIEDPNKAAGTHSTSADVMAAEQQRILSDHVGMIYQTFPETDPTSWNAYHSMLTLCKENGWDVVLVTPPYLSEYNACFPEDFHSAFRQKVNELVSEYDVLYLDYSHDRIFVDSYSHFKNIDHLNYEGAKLFYSQFMKDLQDYNLTR